MKLLIAGSRSYANQLITVCSLLDELLLELRLKYLSSQGFGSVSEVISGCASGVDHAAIVWADNHNIPCTKMPAKWSVDGKTDYMAGFKRNEEMAKLCDYAIIIWDKKSRGTADMMRRLDTHDKEYLLWDKLPVVKRKGSGIVAVGC